MLERETALGELAAALDEVQGGRGIVALVSGEAGIGKTMLLRTFAASRPEGSRLLLGGCDHLAVPRPLGPLLEIADRLPFLARRLQEDPTGASRAVAEALRRQEPAVCILEDVHWADEATLDVVTHLARRIDSLRILLVLSFRDDELADDHPLRRALAGFPADQVRRIALLPLTKTAVGSLVGPEHDAAALHALTGGNPFFVSEIIAQGGEDPTPPSVRDAVLGRLARLTSEGREVARLVSVVPAQAERWLVQDCLRPSVDALADCEARGILVLSAGYVRFRHELARRAVEGALPASRRIALNRAVLAALELRDVPVTRLAHHAAEAEDPGRLLRHGLAAGREAASARSHREAFALLGAALEHGHLLGDVERAEGLELLSDMAFRAGEATASIAARRQALELRRRLGDPVAIGASLRWLSRLHWWAGDRASAESTAVEAVELLESASPGRELALALSNRAQLAMLAQDRAGAVEWAQGAILLARELGDVEVLVHAQTNLGSALVFGGTHGGTRRVPEDDVERAFALLNESAELALQARLDEHACRAMGNHAWLAKDFGRYDEARDLVTRTISLARDSEQGAVLDYHLANRARIDLASGRWEMAARAAAELVASPSLVVTISLQPALVVLGLVEARRGLASGRRRIEQAWAMAASVGEVQRVRPAACARAELAWLAGDLTAIDALTRGAYLMALEFGHDWDVGEIALWRHRAGCLAESPACPLAFALEIAGDARAAAGEWHRIGAPHEEALALLHAGDHGSLRDALAILDRLGSTAAADKAREALRQGGALRVPRGPRPSTRANPAGLTRRQAEVLDLILEGLSNPEIGRRLVVSPKTVEQHVAAVLAKLGVGSRAAATDAASSLGIAPRQPS